MFVKLCKDCKWFKEGFMDDKFSNKCNHPKNKKINLVTGKRDYIIDNAYYMRYGKKYGTEIRRHICGCGIKGDWFEEKFKDPYKNMIIKKKIGKFSVNIGMIESLPKYIMMVMSNCIILSIETDCINNVIEYLAYSPLFEEVEPGQQIPEYSVIIDDNEVEFIKKMD